ncbi:MAG TPA: hypothetical protein VKA24_14615 [Gaiellaceae bacterium]|nr:hypothetical protein [Gaiellaceae bacterium]
MRRLILLLAVAMLALPAPAVGKGPSAATMEGPGGGGGITFSGDEGSGPLGNLTQQSGWFAAVFEQEPNPMLTGRPKGELGPKYTVTYTVPGPDNDTFTITQDVYPYASSGPVTYLAPGQPIFDMQTRGGWFQAGPDLKETLVAAGLPETAPGSSSDDTSFPTTTVGLLAFALLLAGATALLLRRRARPAAA